MYHSNTSEEYPVFWRQRMEIQGDMTGARNWSQIGFQDGKTRGHIGGLPNKHHGGENEEDMNIRHTDSVVVSHLT